MQDTNTFEGILNKKTMQIVLDTRGLEVSVKNQCFEFSTEAESRLVHPGRISSILITAACRISSPALILAAENQIPVVLCNNKGEPVVRAWSPLFINISTLRRKQYEFDKTENSAFWAVETILKKIEGQIGNMNYMADRKPALKDQVNKSVNDIRMQSERLNSAKTGENSFYMKQLLFVEAYAAAKYWQLIGIKLPPPFTFSNRNKRSPDDQFNASINYLYAMLRNHTEAAILTIGLDPALGIMHRDGYKMPSLVFDIMEPFRPVIDRMLLTAIVEAGFKEVDEELIKTRLLSRPYRKKLIEMFLLKLENRITFNNRPGLLKNHIIAEVQSLADKIKSI